MLTRTHTHTLSLSLSSCGAGGDQLAGISFPVVVLDEGSQCAEPEALIPLTKVRVQRWQ